MGAPESLACEINATHIYGAGAKHRDTASSDIDLVIRSGGTKPMPSAWLHRRDMRA
ncbi:hypothetical protein SAMN02745674_00822 [Lysobacter spongiicola DSM 21749]|uniref:Nucleotidyltransferase domain-containing protein n=1 Tax=Lysobacter spongiicola DSM 21749 TaxID=1122188 RepID=A0A1T4NCA5_9GAMM|nr:hypothetical protein SAMN02745674_00822 [Lysobacter spongiicola DSM 21749]